MEPETKSTDDLEDVKQAWINDLRGKPEASKLWFDIGKLKSSKKNVFLVKVDEEIREAWKETSDGQWTKLDVLPSDGDIDYS